MQTTFTGFKCQTSQQ